MRWLCLDPGAKWTGLAVSSPEGTFAVPLMVLQHGPDGPPLEQLSELVREHHADGLVIGLPLNMNGSISSQTLSVLELARRIAAHFGSRLEQPPGPSPFEAGDKADAGTVRVLLWDERLSSWDAQRLLCHDAEHERKRKRAKKRSLDAHAAAVILQSFLDAHADESPGLDGARDETGNESGSAG